MLPQTLEMFSCASLLNIIIKLLRYQCNLKTSLTACREGMIQKCHWSGLPDDLFDASKEAPERKDTVLTRFRPSDGGALRRAGVVAVRPLPLHVDALLRESDSVPNQPIHLLYFQSAPNYIFTESIPCLNPMPWVCTRCIWSTNANMKQWDYLMVSTCAAP